MGGIATLSDFTLHLDSKRVELREVKVVHYGRTLNLIGTVKKVEATDSTPNPQIVVKVKNTENREAMIRLVLTRRGDVLAFERGELLGRVIWDTNTSAIKLPRFMLALLGVP